MKDKEFVNQTTEEEVRAVAAEVAKVENAIAKHEAGIASLTAKLVLGRYTLGRLVLSLPGASGGLKQAKGEWRKKAVKLCGNKDRLYASRDTYFYFEDPSDSTVRQSGATGEERAKAFGGSLAKLDTLIGEKKHCDCMRRKREQERENGEVQQKVDCQKSTPIQDATSRYVAPHDECEDDHEPAKVDGAARGAETVEVQAEPVAEAQVPTAGDDDRVAEIAGADGSVQPEADAAVAEEDKDDRRARVAAELVALCGGDVKETVKYLIEHHWDKGEALNWLGAMVEDERKNVPKPAKTAWPPPITCGEVSAPDKLQVGQYVTLGPSRVMVVGDVRASTIDLQDPFHRRGTREVYLPRDNWDQVQATTEEHVKSEFARLGQKLPRSRRNKSGTDDKGRAAEKKPARTRKADDGKRASTVLAVAGA